MVRRIVSWSVARERLAPILMMARTTGLALVPLVFVSADRGTPRIEGGDRVA